MKFFILFLLISFPLFSQDILQEEKESIFERVEIEGVSKHTESPEDAPAFVYIINEETIKRYNFKTLDELIRFAIPGFFINNDRLYSFVGSRGIFLFDDYNTKLLLLLNGHILNEPWNNFAGLGREMIVPLELVQRIEIIYGPSALLYGGYSFYGIINVITKVPEKNESNLFINYGSFDTKEIIFSKSLKKNNFSLFYSLGYYSSEGEDLNLHLYEMPDGSLWGGKQEGTDKEKAPFFYFHSNYKDFKFQGRFGYRNKNYPTAWYEAKYGSKNNYVIDRKNFLEISYKKSISVNSEFNFRIFSDYYSFYEHDESEDEEFYPGEEGYFYILPANNLTFGFETRYSYFFKKHFLTLGFEGRSYKVEQGYYLAHLNEEKDPETEVKIKSYHRFKLFYLQDEISLTKSLKFVLGGNYLSISPGKNIALPRFALTYKLKNFNLKLISGQGFRNPSAYETNFYDIDYIQNLSLKPEKMESNEFILSYKFDKNLLKFSIFKNNVRDLIESNEVEVDGEIFYQYQNSGKLKSKGFIGLYEGYFVPFDFKLNFTYQKGEKKEDEGYLNLKGIPEKIIKFLLSYKNENFSIGLSSFWQSEVHLLEDHLIQDKDKISSQYLFNLNLNYQIIYITKINLKLKIENLFNNKFYEPTALFVNIPYFPAMKRKLTLGFDLSF